jgi:hypothetical protein
MSEVGVALRIACGRAYQKRVSATFGLQADTSEGLEDPSSGAILITAPVDPKSSMTEHIDWMCDKLRANHQLFQEIMINGAEFEMSCWSHSGQNVGDFHVSKEQTATLAKYRVNLFFRYVVDEVFKY